MVSAKKGKTETCRYEDVGVKKRNVMVCVRDGMGSRRSNKAGLSDCYSLFYRVFHGLPQLQRLLFPLATDIVHNAGLDGLGRHHIYVRRRTPRLPTSLMS